MAFAHKPEEVDSLAQTPGGDATREEHIVSTPSSPEISQKSSLKPSSEPSLNFDTFYKKYEGIIHGLASRDIDQISKNKSIEAVWDGENTAKFIIPALRLLGKAHPVAEVAIGAFCGVVEMYLRGKENNKKVAAIHVKMRSMICVLFQIRGLSDSNDVGHDGKTIEDRIQPMMKEIVKTIENCGSSCDAYMKKRSLFRAIKSSNYEEAFIELINELDGHRIALMDCLLVRTSITVDKMNEKLDCQYSMVKDILKKLETPQEKELSKFLLENDGPFVCIGSDRLLQELIVRSGETASGLDEKKFVQESDPLKRARRILSEELAENVKGLFDNNLEMFGAKLEMQCEQLVDVIQLQGFKFLSAINSGVYESIQDDDMQKLWKIMDWKGTVKSRTFVHALRDYYTDHFKAFSSTQAAQAITHDHPPLLEAHPASTDDTWAITHIDIAHMQPIIEAIDDDGTGFITIKEANTFAIERPKGWSLLQWLAFWAKGWHHSIIYYRSRIYQLAQQMYRKLDKVKFENRLYVDWYLIYGLTSLEEFLRSTKSKLNVHDRLDQALITLTRKYMQDEEERLERNLKKVKYVIDSPATVALITGAGKIERHIYPLLFLILRQHTKVLQAACTHLLPGSADMPLFLGIQSIGIVLEIVHDQIDTLAAVYKQMHIDPKKQFEASAFGMFFLTWENQDKDWIGYDNSFANWQLEDPTTSNFDLGGDIHQEENEDTPLEDLYFCPLESSMIDPPLGIRCDPPPFDIETVEPSISSNVTGLWAGHVLSSDESSVRFDYDFAIRIDNARNVGILEGVFESLSGRRVMQGTVEGASDSAQQVNIIVVAMSGDPWRRRMHGTYDPLAERIDGTYEIERNSNDDEEEITLPEGHGAFVLTRTPPDLVRFRYPINTSKENIVMRRWTFALTATLYRVQKRRWSWGFIKDRITERNWYLSNRTIPVDPTLGVVLVPLQLWNIRQPALVNFRCDACDRTYPIQGYMCMKCMDRRNWLEICDKCKPSQSPFTSNNFVHNETHSLLKLSKSLHDYHFLSTIEKARSLVSEVKRTFRELGTVVEKSSSDANDLGEAITTGGGYIKDLKEMNSTRNNSEEELSGGATDEGTTPGKDLGGGDITGDNSGNLLKEDEDVRPTNTDTDTDMVKLDGMRCVCCNSHVSLPCYVCLDCDQEEVHVFICLECEKFRTRPKQKREGSTIKPDHKLSDTLILIHDSAEEKYESFVAPEVDVTVIRLRGVENNVKEMQENMETKLSQVQGILEGQLNEVRGTMEQRINEVQGVVRERLVEMQNGVEKRLNEMQNSMNYRMNSLDTMIQHLIHLMESK